MKNLSEASSRFIAAVLPLLCASALAQSSPPDTSTKQPDPLDAAVAVPAVVYRSAFTGYRAAADEDIKPWRETNDTAGRIGGWRTYAKQAREVTPADAVVSTDASPDSAQVTQPMPGQLVK